MPSSTQREPPVLRSAVVPWTKLVPPVAQPEQVTRAALLQRVAIRPGNRLVLVHAAAGFGKTTFMAQLRLQLQAGASATAWLTLDRADNDSSRLLESLKAAADAMLGAQQAEVTPLAVLDRLTTQAQPYAFFLDDFQALHEPAALALIRTLLDGLPPACLLVIGSRSLPKLPIARLRALGALVTVETDDLRFSQLEAAELFRHRFGAAVTQHSLHQLVEKTEGWITALWLAAHALAHGGGWDAQRIERFSGSNRAIADYLAEDVFGQQSEAVKDFLLQSSILRHLELPLCAALTPQHDVAAILDGLEKENVVLVALPGGARAWRYQSLFSDFLQDRLMREQPAQAARLHLRACAWYETQDRPVPAIDHAIAAGDHPLALELLIPHAQPLLEQGRMRLLARWLDAVPASAMQAHPVIQAVAIWAVLFTHGPHRAAARLEAIDRDTLDDPQVRPHVNALRPLLLTMCDRYDEAIGAGVDSLGRLPSCNAFADGVLRNAMAHAFMVMGDTVRAQQLIDEARCTTGDTSFNRMYAESIEGMLDLQAGRLRLATARFRTAVNATRAASHNQASGNAWAGMLYASVLYEANELEAAQNLVNVYLPMASNVGLPGHMNVGHMMRARIAFSRGDIDRSFECLTELEYLAHHRKLPRIVANAKLERARLFLLQGNSRAANEELERANDAALVERLTRQRLPANEIDYPALARARWNVHFGDVHLALPWFEQELQQAIDANRLRRALRLRVLYSLALQRHGDPAGAVKEMALAVRHGAAEGFVRVIVDEGPEVGRIVQRIHAMQQQMPVNRSDPVLVSYLDKLLKAFGQLADESHDHVRTSGLMEPLTRKELQVLQLVAEGYSNAAMAEKLNASDSTVRTHLRNINAKLGAHSRAEAVVIARRFGVIR
jgi:LuxR family maltose regulon positive regulatory protein